jgi:hypothetical protein
MSRQPGWDEQQMLHFRMLLRLCNGIMTALAIARNPALSLFLSQVTSEVLARDRLENSHSSKHLRCHVKTAPIL